MATLTVRDLDDEVRERLRARAADHGRHAVLNAEQAHSIASDLLTAARRAT